MIDGNQHKTNQRRNHRIFGERTPDKRHSLTVENEVVEIEIVAGDVENSKMSVDTAAP
ncbi:hypothetical protein [Natronincola peptidivorans]|uniref:hypothetical protein n=1 Tax=Natronincola peptidivorans TaxID=426128 RepID=UPI00147E1D40|nr:hypothetical protein [Natronincola peptidivorans]